MLTRLQSLIIDTSTLSGTLPVGLFAGMTDLRHLSLDASGVKVGSLGTEKMQAPKIGNNKITRSYCPIIYFLSTQADQKVVISCSFELAKYIADEGYTLTHILLTHTHFDHIGGFKVASPLSV